MCGCLCKAKAAVENVPSVEEMAEMAAPAEEEAPAEEAPAEEAPAEEAAAEEAPAEAEAGGDSQLDPKLI